MEYSEIPGVYSEAPRPLLAVRRCFRRNAPALSVAALVLLVLGLATALTLLMSGESGEGDGGAGQDPNQAPSNHSLVMLMSIPWPRRDEGWYEARWRHLTRLPHNSSARQFPPDPSHHHDDHDPPDGPEWTRPDGSTYPAGDTWHWNRRASDLPDWRPEEVSASLSEGAKAERARQEQEERLAALNLTLPRDSPSYVHQQMVRRTQPLASTMARLGYLMDRASSSMRDRLNLTRENSTFDTRWVGDLHHYPHCDPDLLRPRPSPCGAPPGESYRRVDGSCNNLHHPSWGASFTPFRRGLPQDYGDGVSTLRAARGGQELPSARVVSTKVHISRQADSRSLTMLNVAWGQLVDHDLTLTALSKGAHGESISCCSSEVMGNSSLSHPECAPISIPPGDPYYSAFNTTCMEFVRSAPAPRCRFGPREQLNQQTSYLDGSAVYGTTEDQLAGLRSYTRGLLKTQVTVDGREMLPGAPPGDTCSLPDQTKYDRPCFMAGDPRVNENLLLTSMHTILARLHNQVAATFADLNPEWGDERTFSESRRVVVAVLQHVTYHEYLPSLLGLRLARHLGLEPQGEGRHTSDYDPHMNPTIANEFAAAAFRFGHSQIQGLVQKVDASERNVEFNQFGSIVFHPFPLYDPGVMADHLRGGGSQHAAAVDTYFSTQVSGGLFSKGGAAGIDLVSVNLQRGRDHGLAGYVRARRACGLATPANFSDLARDMDAGALASIQRVYGHVEDVELYTGGLAERPVAGGVLGPTFACIIGDQFLRLKRGDRFWYEHQDQAGSFTTEQLAAVHRASLARLLCDCVPGLGSIQRWPLRGYSTGNPRLPCTSSSIPRLDLTPWEEGEI